MEKISELSDDLLIKILLFVPTKVAVSTSILSKRWKFLWMWLPKLEFVGTQYSEAEYQRLRCFLERNLPLHRAPVIESFRLKLRSKYFEPKDVKLWVVLALYGDLRKLEIIYHNYSDKNILPSSLYTSKSLVTLKLEGHILLDVPRMVCLPSLKGLQIRKLTVPFVGESLRRLLSICPVLEDLLVEFFGWNVPVGMVTVIVPSLQSLSLSIPHDGFLDGLVIDAPSLRYFKVEVLKHFNESSYSCLVKNMPELREAYVDVTFPIESIMRPITSVKLLTLSSDSDVYGGGFMFNQLEHLKLCVGNDYLPDHLVKLLEDSPNLRVLDLFQMDHRPICSDYWNQPSTVPKCLMSSLQTFKWSWYLGTPQERDLAVYILTNAHLLRTATISSDDRLVPKLDMIKELSLSSRASTTCQLVFD